MFERLRGTEKTDANGDAIGPKGLRQLFSDLGIAEDSLEMYVVLWKLGATHKGVLSRSEWLVAMYKYGIDQTMQFRSKASEWSQEIVENREGNFTEMYNFLYDYVRGEADRQMSVANATAAWSVLFKKLNAKLLQSWIQWISQEYHRPVSRDLWRQIWQYFSQLKDLPVATAAHDAGKWPTAIDDYVAWVKAHS